MEPNQHIQNGVREEVMGIDDGIGIEWPLCGDVAPPSDVGDEKNQRALESMEQEDLQFNIVYRAQYYEAMNKSDYQMK
eukprot:11525268-Ditylum_brightwellii.AAC.1